MDSTALPNIALTYANDRHTDGAGAQLQRIYGIYAISRFLQLPYIHSPLKRIGYQGLSALESDSCSAEVESRYNRIFEIGSDIELPKEWSIRETTNADLDFIRRVQIDAKTSGMFALIRVLYPYSVTDRIPDIYQHVKVISPFHHDRSEVFRLALHVRRGELFVVDSERMLPNSYYVACALQFVNVLRRLDIPFVCELYTEVPSKMFTVTPQHHGVEGRIPGNVTLDPGMNRLEDFDTIPNLVRFVNCDPIETLRRMATADALVLSRSSYSYVSAILNTNCIVVYHPFWHSPLSEWLTSDSSGTVSGPGLLSRLESWKRKRY
jgi:hypothetical protein